MEQVKPTENPLLGGTSTKGSKTKGTNVQFTNTHWTKSIKKCWEVANIVSLNKMLEAKNPSANAPLPKFGDQDACLSWLIKGWCFKTCQHAATHKHAGSTMVNQVHVLLDACDIPTSN